MEHIRLITIPEITGMFIRVPIRLTRLLSLMTPSTVIAGETVSVTISPSSGNSYGGTITYSVEVNVDETGWEPYTETTSTSFTFTIPEGCRLLEMPGQGEGQSGVYVERLCVREQCCHRTDDRYLSSVFAVMPDDKNLGYLRSSAIVTYLVTTDDNVNYTISVTSGWGTIS